LQTKCSALFDCLKPATTIPATTNPTTGTISAGTTPACTDDMKEFRVSLVLDSSGSPQAPLTAESAPAFCSAGYNYDRNTPEGPILDQIRRGLQAGGTAAAR
jgi:hypothetical protein